MVSVTRHIGGIMGIVAEIVDCWRWSREDRVIWWLLVGFAALVGVTISVAIVGAVADHANWCRRGHWESAHRGGTVMVQPIMMFDGRMGMTPQYVPPHEARVWVCDEK